MERLHDYSQRMSGARMMHHRLKDHKMIDLKGDDKIYRDAYLDCLFANPHALELWLNGDTPRIGYRNHQRNKKGKLVSCEAYLMEND